MNKNKITSLLLLLLLLLTACQSRAASPTEAPATDPVPTTAPVAAPTNPPAAASAPSQGDTNLESTASGLQYAVLREGTGGALSQGDVVSVHESVEALVRKP